MAAARRRDIDLVVVWRLHRWGRSLVDLVNTLQELSSLKVGFVSLSGDILRDRVKAGIAQARKEGKPHGRPPTVAFHIEKVKELFRAGLSRREIANGFASAEHRCAGCLLTVPNAFSQPLTYFSRCALHFPSFLTSTANDPSHAGTLVGPLRLKLNGMGLPPGPKSLAGLPS